jgi:hypothetical protein
MPHLLKCYIVTPFIVLSLVACSDKPINGSDTGADTALPVADGVLTDVQSDSGSVVDDTASDVSDTDGGTLDTDNPLDTEPAVDTLPESDIPEPDVTASFSNCSELGGERNIYDLQDPQCPDHISPEPVGPNGVDLQLKGVVVTAVFGDTVFVQEEIGGPYSGIAVFTHGLPVDGLEVGMRIDLTGAYSEFYETSQIYAKEWNVLSSGAPPQPYLIDHPHYISTNGALAEMFEGVLVRVMGIETNHTIPDCPHDYGEFQVSGDLRVDDMGVTWDARLGDKFVSITGPLHYSFGNFKLEPRTDLDLNWSAKGSDTAISKCLADECQAAEEAMGTKEIVINELMADPFGSDYSQEWFELHNPSDSESVDISNWEVRDCTQQALPLIGLNLTIPPKGYLVLGMSGSPATNGGVTVDYAYGQGFYLPNTVGAILLYDGSGPVAKLVDQVRYSRFDPWEMFKTGCSLERKKWDNNGSSHESWSTGSKAYGVGDNKGTPGAKNSATQ